MRLDPPHDGPYLAYPGKKSVDPGKKYQNDSGRPSKANEVKHGQALHPTAIRVRPQPSEELEADELFLPERWSLFSCWEKDDSRKKGKGYPHVGRWALVCDIHRSYSHRPYFQVLESRADTLRRDQEHVMGLGRCINS